MIRRLLKTLLVMSAPGFILFAAPASPAPWNGAIDICLCAAVDDRRIPLVYEAIRFWNAALAEAGAPLQFGAVHQRPLPELEAALTQMSAGKLRSDETLPYPSFMGDMEHDLLIILSDADIVSFTEHWEERSRAVIVIKSDKVHPLSLPNVTRNVIAHEMGHIIGLGHNSDETRLMCGRPAPCRPEDFASSQPRFLPLTEEEKNLLRRLYGNSEEQAELLSSTPSTE